MEKKKRPPSNYYDLQSTRTNLPDTLYLQQQYDVPTSTHVLCSPCTYISYEGDTSLLCGSSGSSGLRPTKPRKEESSHGGETVTHLFVELLLDLGQPCRGVQVLRVTQRKPRRLGQVAAEDIVRDHAEIHGGLWLVRHGALDHQRGSRSSQASQAAITEGAS